MPTGGTKSERFYGTFVYYTATFTTSRFYSEVHCSYSLHSLYSLLINEVSIYKDIGIRMHNTLTK